MSEILRADNEFEAGFLPHEINFIMSAIQRAISNLDEANKEYGEAVASSGGDWAFDDPASYSAAVEAHKKDKHLKEFMELLNKLKHTDEIPYPNPDSNIATYGSRIYTVEDDGYAETYDLTTHFIPGMESEDGVLSISPDAPVAKEIFNSKEGDVIKWNTPSGGQFRATIVKIDQLAIKNFFNSNKDE